MLLTPRDSQEKRKYFIKNTKINTQTTQFNGYEIIVWL